MVPNRAREVLEHGWFTVVKDGVSIEDKLRDFRRGRTRCVKRRGETHAISSRTRAQVEPTSVA